MQVWEDIFPPCSPPRTWVHLCICCCFTVDFSLWFLIIWSRFRLHVFQHFFLGELIMARRQLIRSNSKNGLVYVTNRTQNDGCEQTSFLFIVWTMQSSQMEWEIWAGVHLYCVLYCVNMGIMQNISRQIDTHAHISTCSTTSIWKKNL